MYLEHERRVEHVLHRQIETFIQILVGKLFEEMNVVEAVGNGGDFLQANICQRGREQSQVGTQLNDLLAINVTLTGPGQ